MPRSRKPAVLRGLAASSLAIFVALAAHVTAGGAMPGFLGIAVPWVLSMMVSTLLAGRRLSVVRLSISVAVSQFLFHVLFVLGAITPSGAVMPHIHGAPLQLPAGTPLPDAMLADGTMWFGHLIAGLLTVLAVHRGERMLLALRDLAVEVRLWLQRRLGVALFTQQVSSAVPALDSRRSIALPDDPLLAAVRRRGPPASQLV